jgi:hypothetical protein
MQNKLSLNLLNFLIFFAGIADIVGGQRILEKGSFLGKFALGFPFLIAPLFFVILKSLSLQKKNFRLKKINIHKWAIKNIWLMLILGIITGLFFPIFNIGFFRMDYYLSDLLGVLWIYLWLFYFSRFFILNENIISFFNVIYVLSIISLISFVFSSDRVHLNSLGSLSYIVPSLLGSYLVTSSMRLSQVFKGTCRKTISWIGVIRLTVGFWVMLFLSIPYFLGYQKISFFSYIFCFTLTIYLVFSTFWNQKKVSSLLLVVLVICFTFTFVLNQSWLSGNLGDAFLRTRTYNQILNNSSLQKDSVELDESSEARVLEAIDSSIFFTDNLPLSLLGFGHGSSYPVVFSPILSNATEEGFIHNIHIGVVLLTFRYGLVGILFWLTILLSIIISIFSISKDLTRFPISNNTNYLSAQMFIFSFLMLSSLFVQFSSQNILINPMFGISLGIFLQYYNIQVKV